MKSGSGSSGISVGNISGKSDVLYGTVVVGGGVVTTTGSDVETGIVEEAAEVDEGIESVDVMKVDVADLGESVVGMVVSTEALKALEVVTVFQE